MIDYNIQNGPLTVTLDPGGHIWTIADQRTGRMWRSAAMPDCRVVDATRENEAALCVQILDIESARRFAVRVTVPEVGAVRFDLDTQDTAARFAGFQYPTQFETALADGALVFCHRSCGQLVPQAEPYPAPAFMVNGNLGLDMPWIGLIDLRRGDGMMVHYDTSYDVVVHLARDAAGLAWPQTEWLSVKDTWAYSRAVTLYFVEQGGYVALAQRYRQIVEQAGGLKTLRQKATARPNVELLRGAVVAWGASGAGQPDVVARQFRAHGIDRSLFYCDTHIDPQQVQTIRDMDYLESQYSNMVDMLESAEEPIADAAMQDRAGESVKNWLTFDGKTQYYRRSPALELEAFKRLVEPVHTSHGLRGRFVDVTPALDLVEDFHPAHPLDRRADLAARRALLKYVVDHGWVLGGEHGKAWNVDLLDYNEGMLSGAFWWEMPGGHLRTVATRQELKPNYLRWGANPAGRIPLWDLVFHDCVVSTWYWGDANGQFAEIAPEIAARRELWNILHAQMPMVWLANVEKDQNICFGWNRRRADLLRVARNTSRWQGALMGERMLDHRWLSDDAMLQETRFSGGGQCLVNFDDKPREALFDGRKILLTPFGFMAVAPGIHQARLMEGGLPITRIEAPHWRSLESAARTQSGPFDVDGTVCAWRDGAETRLMVDTRGETGIDLAQLGWPVPEQFRLVPLDEQGAPAGANEITGHRNKKLRIAAGPGIRLYAVR